MLSSEISMSNEYPVIVSLLDIILSMLVLSNIVMYCFLCHNGNIIIKRKSVEKKRL